MNNKILRPSNNSMDDKQLIFCVSGDEYGKREDNFLYNKSFDEHTLNKVNFFHKKDHVRIVS